jgi:glycosyltransferase involved in cell wall biosynthesis
VPGIGPDDKVVIWAGGVYNWFDPLTLVRAVDRLRLRVPTIRLFFMGMQHPNPHIPAMRMADEVRALSTELGLTGSHVFFNDSWVEYDHRADYLLDADIGVSTHLGHVETAYSFRTRILDYLWTGLPIVATGGDAFGALIEGADLGAAVPPGDEAALEGALHHLLSDDAALARCRANVARVAPEFQWEAALLPLVEFCRHPRPAPDREHRRAAALSVTPAQSGAAPPPAARSMSRKLVGRTRRFGGRLLRAARRRVRGGRTTG